MALYLAFRTLRMIKNILRALAPKQQLNRKHPQDL